MSSSLTMADYIDYIKLSLTAGVLELEIEDNTIEKFVNASLKELQRYIDETKFIQVPFAKCISLEDFNHSAIIHVYRTEGFTGDTGNENQGSSDVDPMFAQRWAAFTNGGSYSLNNYVMNYLAYNTLMQIRNTMSTDLAFKEDKNANKLYINVTEIPKFITIEYIPIFESVEEITSDYWIDILKKMSLAMTKVALGRVRTRFTQSNALWNQDGETMLSEGNEELKELRELLRLNSNMFFPVD